MTIRQIKNENNSKSYIVSKETLPPKKRFGQYCEASKSNKIATENIDKKSTILPGVIRHTSCPDHSLAYFLA